MTIKELSLLYLNNHLANRSSYETTRRLLRNTFGPLDNIPVLCLKNRQVLEWHKDLAHTPHQANRALGVLRSMYRWGSPLELCTHDPSGGVKRFPVESRYRFLSKEELAELLKQLQAAEHKIRLFVLWTLGTGCRRSEARNARWSEIDLANKQWTKPKTKSGRWQVIPLPDQLVQELQTQPRFNKWLFPGATQEQPWSLAGIEKAWGKIRRSCKLTDVRIHDLRRTAASHMAMAGENLTTIQKMLDHSSLQATAIYARLDLNTLSQAMQRNADRIFSQESKPC